MSRRTATRPEVRVGGFWLSSIVPQGWGQLKHSTRLNGSWQASWAIPNANTWRHPALVYGARVEICLGPIVTWAGTLEEPDWDGGEFIAIGACRDGETAIALDGSGNSSTVPNTVIDAAIARGVLSWTRVGDFGTTAVGDANSGLVTVQSVLDAWAAKNGSRWYVNEQRQLVISPLDETNPKWFIVPGSGVLGSAAEERVDRVFVRYIDSATGARATASYPATSPTGGIEKPLDATDRGAMTSAAALTLATNTWTDHNSGRSGFTNGWTLTNGQVTTKGGGTADLALLKAGDTVAALGLPDARGIAHNTLVVLGETDYDWEDDELQANPNGLAARDIEGALEAVGNLAVDALAAASKGGASFEPFAAEASVFGSNYNVGSTTPGNVGNTLTIPSAGTSAIYLATFTVVGQVSTAGIVNFVSFAIDGAAWNSDLIRTHSPSGTNFFTVTRTVRLTGLSAGNHTVGIRSWNNAAGTTVHNGVDSTITVVRVG